MEFFATAEAYKEISRKLVDAQNLVSKKLKLYLSDKTYGNGVSFWGHVSICCPPEFYEAGFFKEIKKYTKKDKEIELRLKIDYEDMLHANTKQTYNLICNSILKGINVVEEDLKVPDFNFTEFRNDMTALFKKEGWL